MQYAVSRFVLAYICLTMFCQPRTAQADLLTFNITGGTLVLSGNANVTGAGNFNYTAQVANSLSATYAGTFTVDVNNVFAPTSIAFNSAAVDANTSGTYSPNNAGNAQTPQAEGDYGIRVNEILANGKLRNLVFNVAAASTTVNAGSFSNANQSWSYSAGNIDVFSDVLNDGTSATLTGSGSNTNATLGTYSVVGNTATLTIPVTISIAYTLPGTPVVTGFNNYSGTLTAISAVPEPTSILLSSIGVIGIGFAACRKRNR